jgi:hypothetical protein
MTEADWNSSTDPQAMLAFLQDSGKLSERKARLCAVARCRRIWRHLKDERSRRLIEVAELFADGLTSVLQLREAFNQAAEGQEAIHYEGGDAVDQSAAEAVLGLRDNLQMDQISEGIAEAVGEARAGEAWERIYLSPGNDYRMQEAEYQEECDAGAEAEQIVQAALLRDLFGPLPFRSITFPPCVRTWNEGTVQRLAEAAYQERALPASTLDLGRLAVLADALEEAGCDDEEILGHLRGPGSHVRGCWVVDLLTGRQ